MKTKTGKLCWTHHPRGGRVEGYASEVVPGVYGPERRLATTPEDAAQGLGFSAPDSQIEILEENNR